MTAGCDYANARVRAMRGRLLGRAGIENLLAQSGLSARLEYLKRTDYGDTLAAHLGREPDQLAAVERGLRARFMGDLARIDRFLEGERPRALFRAFLAFEDGWTLKTVLRGVAAGEAPEQIFVLLAQTPELDHAALGELVRQREVKAVVDLLAIWRSPYAHPLGDALAAYASRRELLHLEVALDRFLFGHALEAARRDGGEDGAVLLRFLATQIDLVNTATLLKLAGQGAAEEFFIPGGRLLGRNRFRRYGEFDAPRLRAALASEAPLLFAARPVGMAVMEDPFAADQIVQRALVDTMRGEARESPLSLAVPLAFVLDLQAEIRQIRLVLRGAEFGLPPGELLELIEA